MGRLTIVVLMLTHRPRRWGNIKTTLGKHPVFAGHHKMSPSWLQTPFAAYISQRGSVFNHYLKTSFIKKKTATATHMKIDKSVYYRHRWYSLLPYYRDNWWFY